MLTSSSPPSPACAPCVSRRDPLQGGHRHGGSLGSDDPGPYPHLTPPPALPAASRRGRPGRSGPALPHQPPLPGSAREGSCHFTASAARAVPGGNARLSVLAGEALHANDWALSGCNCHCLADHPPAGEPAVWGGVGTEWQWKREKELALPVSGPGCEGTAVSKERIHVPTQPRGSRATAINPLHASQLSHRGRDVPASPSRSASQARGAGGLQRAAVNALPPTAQPCQPAPQEPGHWHRTRQALGGCQERDTSTY